MRVSIAWVWAVAVLWSVLRLCAWLIFGWPSGNSTGVAINQYLAFAGCLTWLAYMERRHRVRDEHPKGEDAGGG